MYNSFYTTARSKTEIESWKKNQKEKGGVAKECQRAKGNFTIHKKSRSTAGETWKIAIKWRIDRPREGCRIIISYRTLGQGPQSARSQIGRIGIKGETSEEQEPTGILKILESRRLPMLGRDASRCPKSICQPKDNRSGVVDGQNRGVRLREGLWESTGYLSEKG